MTSTLDSVGHKLTPEVVDIAAHMPLKPDPFTAKGRFISITPMEMSDLPELWAAFSGEPYLGHPAYDPNELVWLYMRSNPGVGKDAFFSYVGTVDESSLRMVVRENEGNQVIGMFTWMANRPRDLVAEIGFVAFTPAYQGTPANTEATYMFLRRGFEIGYQRLEWKCNYNNERSRNAATRIGFVFEGIFRRHMIVQGCYARGGGRRRRRSERC